MKTKTLFEIAVKIIGLIALWKFIQSFSGIVTGLGVLTMLKQAGGMQNPFMIIICLSNILNVFVIGATAYFCLLKTNKVLTTFSITGDETVAVNTDKKIVYHVVIIFLSGLMIINGAGECLSYDYSTNTNTVANIQNNQVNNQSSTTQNETKKVNYFAFIELLGGFILLVRSPKVTLWLIDRFEEETEEEYYKKNRPL
jgi:hypothetical protein